MAEAKDDLEEFVTEVRTWIAENFPPSLKGRGAELMGAETIDSAESDALAWGKRLGAKGWRRPPGPPSMEGVV